MTFEKTEEIIERVDSNGGFLIIRKIKPIEEEFLSTSDDQLITDIIQSKYHHWQGEKEPNGLTVAMSSKNKFGKSSPSTLTGYKFYGFYDNSKIKANHYKKTTFDDFYDRLIVVIEKETESDNKFLQLSKTIINKNLKPLSTYYFLDLDQEKNKDLVAEWQVYDFFYAFISLDRENNCIYLIEFGLD